MELIQALFSKNIIKKMESKHLLIAIVVIGLCWFSYLWYSKYLETDLEKHKWEQSHNLST